MPIYTLYLRTNATSTTNPIYRINRSTYGQSVTWMVNFDDLFKNENYNFKNCRISSQMGYAFVLTALLYNNIFGYISVSIGSEYNASTTNGTIIDVFNTGNFDLGNTLSKFRSNTFGTKGINISVPQGNVFFTINLIRPTGILPIVNTVSEMEYSILLKFELY